VSLWKLCWEAITRDRVIELLVIVLVLMLLGVIPSPYVSQGKAIEVRTETKVDAILALVSSQLIYYRINCRNFLARTEADRQDCNKIGIHVE